VTAPRGSVFRAVAVVALLAAATAAGAGAVVYAGAPVEALRGRVTYGPAGHARGRVTGLDAEGFVRLDEVPEDLLVGLLFNEDKRFFDHSGFDVAELAISLREWAAGARGLRGASTLTQQLARTAFLSSERTLGRKAREALYALKLERHFTKDEILALYVNTVDWGAGVHGIADAAAHYFGRVPDALQPRECAFLVAILPSPSRLAAAFAKRRGTPLRMRRVLDALGRAEAMRTGTLRDPDDPITRLVAGVAGARERASAARAAR
jgi:penicillin-binding protein 1A